MSDRLVLPVQSEREFVQACPEPRNQSFIPNAQDSPIRYEHTLGEDRHHIRADFSQHVHPCGSGHFTWAVIGWDQAFQPELPSPQDLVLEFDGWFNTELAQGTARTAISAQFFYNGRAHLVTISTLAEGWPDGDPLDDILWRVPDIAANDGLEYVVLDGEALDLGFVEGENRHIVVEFWPIVEDLINRELLETPTTGITTQTWFIGLEFRNDSVGGLDNPSGTADVIFSEPTLSR